jgi:uncharacterized protein (TIGR04255 family)
VFLSAHGQTIDDLGSFDRPPVTEVVLGVQFAAPVVDLDVLATFGLRVKDRLPVREQHPPLPRVEESFSVKFRSPRIQLKVLQGFELPRAWFVSADQREVVQLQSDRLVVNWRRMAPDDRYPRYAKLRPLFDGHLATLQTCLTELGKPIGTVDFVEVTYLNEVAVPGAPEARHPPLSQALSVIREPPAGGSLPQAEDSTFNARYRIPDPAGGGQPAGRLYVGAEPRLRSADLVPIYLLRMTSHIVTRMPDNEAVLQAMDLGRTWAKKGFDELTTPEIRNLWQPLTTEGT